MKTSSNASDNESPDVISILTDDHNKVKQLFKDFEDLKDSGSDDEIEALVDDICNELTIHTEAEESIFYPAARAIGEDLIDEAEVEHASARDLISQLQMMRCGDPKYNAKVAILREYVTHHIAEEENKIFPQVKKAKLDLVGMGEDMMDFKESAGISTSSSQQRGNATEESTRMPRH